MLPMTATPAPRVEWTALTDTLQIELAEQALVRASATVAEQAERLAADMQDGHLADRGGPDALRLLAAILRATARDRWSSAGDRKC